MVRGVGKKDWGPRSIACSPTTSLFRALPATTTSARVLLKRNAGIHRVVSSNILTWSEITTGADDAFVKYLCHTKNGKSFRNVEYFRIKNGKLQSIECYFGAQSSFPSAVSTGQK